MIQKPRVLVVDDDEDICFLLTTVVDTRYADVFTARSGEEALDRFHQMEPQLILLDVQLPEMSGIDVLQIIKRERPDCQVIMVTAFATIETAIKAMKLGALDYICKPFKLPELRDTVKNALEYALQKESIFTLEEVEKTHIIKVLQEVEGNRRLAAEKLDISLRTLYYKIKQYDIYIKR